MYHVQGWTAMQQQNRAGCYLGLAIFDSFMVSGYVVYELSVCPSCMTETCLCMCMWCHFLLHVHVSGNIVVLFIALSLVFVANMQHPSRRN